MLRNGVRLSKQIYHRHAETLRAKSISQSGIERHNDAIQKDTHGKSIFSPSQPSPPPPPPIPDPTKNMI